LNAARPTGDKSISALVIFLMKPKTILIVVAAMVFAGLGVYAAIVEGVEPRMAPCSKYSLICH